ncbi:spore coat protein CotD [Bacillus sp. L381]|uniref:spore coat protein CotD n=1 Tax=Bacillus TaxID=1386 RepID=UPI001BADAAFB|nr:MULTISPECIES: spore coat protein CotD [Bacillus]MCR9038584.1 spore coat protein [Bacillus velezensis]QUN07934.1 spore coat protein [Bacillus amyloliquefaciens]QYM81000.1 spore coat protein [Bacillus sp. 7D3]QZY10147.1 spore coat protein [Bacillus amyloliquefaciens]WIX23527.1 spore coat protein CotD [Bacillus sp. L381]
MFHHHHHCCRPNVMPPIVHPTNCCEHHCFTNTVVPHIHPQHTTNVNHHNFEHVHYYPHTFSNVDPTTHQHFQCGSPCCDY